MIKVNKDSKKSPIVQIWNFFFGLLEKMSIFFLIKVIRKKFFNKDMTHNFVDYWVIFNFIFSVCSSIFISVGISRRIITIIMLYGLLRVFEIIVYQINLLLFHPYRSFLAGKRFYIKSPTRSVILLFHNYFEIIFWFATIHKSILVLNNTKLIESWFYYIKMSVLCFSTFDTTLIFDEGILNWVSNIAFVELIAGVIITLVCLARFIGLLPDVKSMGEHIDEDKIKKLVKLQRSKI